jgi:hypothetical protein
MARKISFLLLSVAILITGVIAFRKLNYWERSARIFIYSSDTPSQGRTGRGPGRSEGRDGFGERGGFNRQEGSGERFARPEMRQLPDSRRERFGAGEERMGHNEGRGRGEFPGGKKVNLRSVYWFLAVFASLTVFVIYFEKAICLIRRRQTRQEVFKKDTEL